MASIKRLVLSESGYPKKHKLFERAMDKLWNDEVPKKRRAALDRFERFVIGADQDSKVAAATAEPSLPEVATDSAVLEK